MRRLPFVLALTATLPLVGCETFLEQPHYSAEYRTVSDAQGRTLLVPEACLAAAVTSELEQTTKLAPGCANAFNLLQMVERREDLQRGRRSGPALAAPVGRAAQLYLEGFESAAQRRQWQEQAAQSQIGGAP